MTRHCDDIGAPCICCGGELIIIGTLGNTDWFRCRDCGADQYAPAEPQPVGPSSADVYPPSPSPYRTRYYGD